MTTEHHEFWDDIIRRVSVRPGIDVRVWIDDSKRWPGGLVPPVVVSLRGIDIHTGQPTETHHLSTPPLLSSTADAISWVRATLADALYHELNELLCFDGIQVRSPHLRTGSRIRLHDGRLAIITSVDYESGDVGAKLDSGEEIDLTREQFKFADEP